MAVLPSDIRTEYEEFSGLTDQQIQPVLDRAARQIVSSRWGIYQDDGIKAFTAHFLYVRYISMLQLGSHLKAIESDKSKPYTMDKFVGSFESTPYGLEYLQLFNQLPNVGWVV